MVTINTARQAVFTAIAFMLGYSCFSQVKTKADCWNSILKCEANASLSSLEKISKVEQIKKRFEELGFAKDSIYARILHRLGYYQFDGSKELIKAIANTQQAVRINVSGKAGSCKKFAANSYKNLGYYYKSLEAGEAAVDYLDSSIMIATSFTDLRKSVLECRSDRCNIFFEKGDIQKCIDEANLGINAALTSLDTLYQAVFLSNRARGNLLKGKITEALKDATKAQQLAASVKDYFEVARSLKIQGFVYEQLGQYPKALNLLIQTINTRKKAPNAAGIDGDYIDAGNLLLNKIKDYERAGTMYLQAIKYGKASGSVESPAIANINFGVISLLKKEYIKGLQYNSLALSFILNKPVTDPLLNPSAAELSSVGFKDMVLNIFGNKTELLLLLFKQTHDKKYLQASLQTAILTEALITDTRHKQVAEQSKLYWRNRTREFFVNALEACYQANDNKLAFFFMEKSRAVLLNDKLNELGANAHLPPAEALAEEKLRQNIIIEEQKLSLFDVDSKEYNNQQSQVLAAKEKFERYIHSLEKNYPAYYSYRYQDEVSSLAALQQYLEVKKQSFIHYFISDTVAYILTITPGNAVIKKLSKNEFDVSQPAAFLQLCSDKQKLDHNYPGFASLSNTLYNSLFKVTGVPKGRVVICPDNFIIPFEALCSDTQGKNFLAYDYAFSYVYSARYLLKNINSYIAKENFIGIAPVYFQPALNMPALIRSGNALDQSASFYKSSNLLKNKDASRANFINKIGSYSIVNVFSHAFADSSDNEPLLFMQDSVIRLSELQLLTNPATKLVVLSACQTNVGKNATGEGIYSLARGFTSAGIPSVAATLWQADEETIYAISEKFHQHLSEGMTKDEALQKAKLSFMENGHSKLLPYYWANMILIGNADPVDLSTSISIWWWIGGSAVAVTLLLLLFVYLRKKNSRKAI